MQKKLNQNSPPWNNTALNNCCYSFIQYVSIFFQMMIFPQECCIQAPLYNVHPNLSDHHIFFSTFANKSVVLCFFYFLTQMKRDFIAEENGTTLEPSVISKSTGQRLMNKQNTEHQRFPVIVPSGPMVDHRCEDVLMAPSLHQTTLRSCTALRQCGLVLARQCSGCGLNK